MDLWDFKFLAIMHMWCHQFLLESYRITMVTYHDTVAEALTISSTGGSGDTILARHVLQQNEMPVLWHQWTFEISNFLLDMWCHQCLLESYRITMVTYHDTVQEALAISSGGSGDTILHATSCSKMKCQSCGTNGLMRFQISCYNAHVMSPVSAGIL